MQSYVPFEPEPPQDNEIDPDPFSIAFSILAIMFSGGAYLEARQQRALIEKQARDSFRAAWFESRRTLIHARRVVEEFATYVAEDQFGATEFIFGKVKLSLDRGRAQNLRRLHGNAHTTASYLADNLDDLANNLDPSYQELIDTIHSQLRGISQFPGRYRDVIKLARDALSSYENLIDNIGDREKFEELDSG